MLAFNCIPSFRNSKTRHESEPLCLFFPPLAPLLPHNFVQCPFHRLSTKRMAPFIGINGWVVQSPEIGVKICAEKKSTAQSVLFDFVFFCCLTQKG